MATRLNPYVNFPGNARTAMEFYQTVFSAQLYVSTFKDFGMSANPSDDDKVMHSMLETDSGLALMAADMPGNMEYRTGTNFSISLSGEDEAELRGYWEKLAAGGTILEPLVQAPWGDTFGMLIDQFGITWMVNIAGQRE